MHTQEINSTCSNFAKAVISEKKLKSSFVFSLIVVDIKHPCKTLISCIYLDAALFLANGVACFGAKQNMIFTRHIFCFLLHRSSQECGENCCENCGEIRLILNLHQLLFWIIDDQLHFNSPSCPFFQSKCEIL